MKEIQDRLEHAFDEVRRLRDELRVKLNLLGKDARDALADAEELLETAERKLEIAVRRLRAEAQAARDFVRERIDRARA
jgi:hypothetical protein